MLLYIDIFSSWQQTVSKTPGFTAFLVTRLPQRACDLSDSTLDSLKPQEGVDFQKRLVPIFKGDLDANDAMFDLDVAMWHGMLINILNVINKKI